MTETQKIYQNHRDNQRERILDAAEVLFIREGIDNVSMNEIAEEARIARKTLYTYFPNKLEIAFGIVEKFLDTQKHRVLPLHLPEGNGFQQLSSFLMGIPEILDQNAEFYRFMAEFDVLYARGGDPGRVHQVFSLGNEILLPILQKGIKDGSVRPEFDAEFLAGTIFNMVSGMNSRFARMGDKVSGEYGRPSTEFYQELIRIFLQGIQCSGK